MLWQRILVIIVLLPVGLAAIWFGGWFYIAVILAFMGLAAWEYTRLFHSGGYRPAEVIVIGGSLALVVGRAIDGFGSAPWIISFLVLCTMAWHLLAYERGRDQSAVDFAITLGGFMYIGWIGAYFVSLRDLPQGVWWVFLVLAAVWAADSSAYSIGIRWGRRRLAPRLSPKKSWEGYWAGVVGGTLIGAALAWAFGAWTPAGPTFTLWRGALMGFLLGILPTLGDLGESMIKRQFGIKDSSNLLPGHGGFFDRVDSWLWAVVIGYALVALLFQ